MRQVMYGLLGFAIIAVLWHVVFSSRALPSFLNESPTTVIAAVARLLLSASTWESIWLTTRQTLASFVTATVLGVLLGLLISAWDVSRQCFEPVVDFLRSIPSVAVLPLFVVACGVGEVMRVMFATAPTLLVIAAYTITGIKGASRARREYAATLGPTRWDLFWYVVLPDALPSIVGGLRVAISLCLVLILVAEMLFPGSQSGIGTCIYNARYATNYRLLYGYIVIAGILGFALNALVHFCDVMLIHWRGR